MPLGADERAEVARRFLEWHNRPFVLPATESLDDAFARLQFTDPRTLADLRLVFPGPVPDDARLLRSYAAVLAAVTDSEAQLEAERTTVAGSTAEGRDLANEVRRLQKERPDARAQWAAYCHEQTNGVKDPLRHSVASLRDFLSQFDL